MSKNLTDLQADLDTSVHYLNNIKALDKRGYPHIFLISPQKHMLWYSLEAPRRGASNEYHKICFHGEIRKKISVPFS